MIDMSKTIEAKSDQRNSCDFIGGPETIKITAVKIVSGDQPVQIDHEGYPGKPFKPCLTVRRLLVLAWGKDASLYIGRSMTLYSDPSVKYGGAEVSGIRVSHMSHIDKPIRAMLTVTRGKKAPVTIQPLQLVSGPPLTAEDAQLWTAEIDRATNMAELSEAATKIKGNNYAESAEKAAVLSHYQSAVAAIRNKDVDPKNEEFPLDESLEGGEDIPGLQ
jgi:hypothetical protein